MKNKEIFNLIVVRYNLEYLIVGIYKESICIEDPIEWKRCKDVAYMKYGHENVRISRMSTRLSWMEELFEVRDEPGRILDQNKEKVISGCADCPMKVYNIGSYYCTHPLNKNDEAINIEKKKYPTWCKLTESSVNIRMKLNEQ